MPKIRLNTAVKEFNISMTRLVEFLQSKGIVVESNPKIMFWRPVKPLTFEIL
jgi:hypothetical protein